jgi:hypothetical protein
MEVAAASSSCASEMAPDASSLEMHACAAGRVGRREEREEGLDISEGQGGRGAEGVDAVEGEASGSKQRWVAGAR